MHVCAFLLLVQIVPLWNWNIYSIGYFRPEECSNCTFMELKLEKRVYAISETLCSNCTFMELKYRTPLRFSSGRGRSNCTFMELKSADNVSQSDPFSVQIVPLWNWNAIMQSRVNFPDLFKLYLYGIEILVRNYNIKQLTVQIVPLWNWNVIIALNDVDVAAFKLYLYGIEIRMAAAMRAKTNSSNCTFMELK